MQQNCVMRWHDSCAVRLGEFPCYEPVAAAQVNEAATKADYPLQTADAKLAIISQPSDAKFVWRMIIHWLKEAVDNSF